MSILSVRGLTYIYGQGTTREIKAINNCSFEIEQGEIIGIIGHTGSGKSTLIQHLNGLLKPNDGQVLINGQDIWESKESVRKSRFTVGLCFQYPEHQIFEETVYKDISFGPKNMKLSDEEIDKRVRESVSYVGLDESYFQKSPFDLSGGEKRRVAIDGVMAMKPEILVIDEPTAGLDPRGRDTLFKMIKSYKEKTGKTVIIVSHSMEDIAKMANKVLVMNKGEVVMYDTVENVFSRGNELIEIGLNVPQITKLFMKFKENGYDVNPAVFTIEQAKKEILRLRGDNLD